MQDDPDFRQAQIFLKNILRGERERVAANEKYKVTFLTPITMAAHSLTAVPSLAGW